VLLEPRAPTPPRIVQLMIILGLNEFHGDSSTALIKDGVLSVRLKTSGISGISCDSKEVI
jgi:hypothetical protein